MDDLADAVGPHVCACGAEYRAFTICQDSWRHLEIQTLIRATFSRGDLVYYNYWAYPQNCPGKVVAWVPISKPERGTYPWGWISIKFDHLKSARQVPVWSAKGCHLSREPLDAAAAIKLCLEYE